MLSARREKISANITHPTPEPDRPLDAPRYHQVVNPGLETSNSDQSCGEPQRNISSEQLVSHNSDVEVNSLANKGRPSMFSTWIVEISSCIAATAAIIAIAVTAKAYQGQPKPQWPDVLSLNTLLSMYGVVFKASLGVTLASTMGQLQWMWFTSGPRTLIDLVKHNNARGGPWGSLQYLWTLKLRQPLAAIGAVLTIIAVGIDPFIQQILSYNDCNVSTNEKGAFIPRTNYFHDLANEADRSTVDGSKSARGAINAGILGSPYTTHADCPTGNCTFSTTFVTVGFCGTCQDISDTVNISSETCFALDVNPKVGTDYYPFSKQACYKNTTFARIVTQLPTQEDVTGIRDHLSVTWDDGPDSKTENGLAGLRVFSNDNIENIPLFDNSTLNVTTQMFRPYIQFLVGKSTFSVQKIDPATSLPLSECNNSETDDMTWRCRGYGAAECAITPCIREYRASILNGNLTETLLDHSNPFQIWGHGDLDNVDYTDGLGVLGVIDTKCLTSTEKDLIRSQGYHVDSQDRWMSYNVAKGYGNNLSATNFSRCIYVIDTVFLQNLAYQYLRVIFPGNLTGFYGADNIALYELKGPYAAQVAYNRGNFSFSRTEELIRNVSDSLTAYVRSNGAKGFSDPATGQVFRSTTCLHVNWVWITLPAVMTVLMIVLVISTTFVARDELIWKDSPLALIFHGLSELGERNPPPYGLATLKGMEQEAAEIKVRLRQDGNRAVLVAQD